MKKTIYLIRGTKKESYEAFQKRILKLSYELKDTGRLEKIKVVLTEQGPPLISVIPFKKRKVASLSLVRGPNSQPIDLGKVEGIAGSFEVEEALPVSYSKTWEDGELTPGICLLTLFRQKPSIDFDTFIDRWHNNHTPLSLKLHPLWNYNRNVVKSRADMNAENWDGIVEEHCLTKADLLNPFKFFGNPLKVVPNMLAVYRDTKSFLDYGSIEPYLASEYHIKS